MVGNGWNMNFLVGGPIFRGELLVSGRVAHPLPAGTFEDDFPFLPSWAFLIFAFWCGLTESTITHTLHVWYIYLHLVDFYGKCR